MTQPGKKIITRTVWILSVVSLFTDVASEMLYPVMPVYLKSIGFSIVLIGVLEGIAEAVAGLSKGYFGNLSDHMGRRVPFVQLGYTLSTISKPMMAVLTTPLWIFSARTLDRLGKGIRTGARDAILSDEATAETKGKVFGFHRSMDTLGAVIGPGFALLYLWVFPGAYKPLFLIAFVPGLLAIISSLLLKEKKRVSGQQKKSLSFLSFIAYWKNSPVAYRKLVSGLLLFALFNSSDVFLLLRARQSGLSDEAVIGIYIFYNLIYAVFAYPLGRLADRIGLRPVFVAGLLLFAFVYFSVAMVSGPVLFYMVFLVYGLYAAATEGISKAWISNVCEKKDTATAIGTFAAFQSICALGASVIAGIIWQQFGAAATFIVTGVLTLVVAGYFLVIRIPGIIR